MKKQFFTALCAMAMLLPTQAKDYKYDTVKGDLMKSRIYTLDNGLKVYLTVNKEQPRIFANIAVRTGSRNDPAETTGLAHYFEHLMFKGTTHFGTSDYEKEKPLLDDIRARFEVYRLEKDPDRRKQLYHEIDSVSQLAAQYFIPNEYNKLMSNMGAKDINAGTSYDYTCYHEDIPSNELDTWLRIQSDRFQNAVIRGFHTELEAVYEEFNMGLADDNEKANNALFCLLFPKHSYGTQTIIGTQEHLKNPSILNIENYYKRYYVPNNTAICMSGDFDPDVVIAQIDKYFGNWQPNPQLSRPEFPALAPISAPKDTTVVGLEAEQLQLAWRFPAGKELSTDTLFVISDMMTNGKAGVMDLNLKQPMKVDFVGAYLGAFSDYAQFYITVYPVEGQTLEEARALVLSEIERMKRGEFSDDLLEAVKNNYKLLEYSSLLSNKSRVSKLVDAFINGRPWDVEVGQMERIQGMTKQQIVDFLNRHFRDNFVCVYKRKGEDNSVAKIEKPTITPIPANRDMTSKFFEDIVSIEPEPIQPVFVDYDKDMTITKTKQGLPLLYKQNTDDGIFHLAFRYEFGGEDVRGFDIAPDYLSYIGTDKKTLAQINQEFYKLACSFGVSVGSDVTTVYLNGLNENLPKALALLEDYLQNAKADRESYDKFVDLLNKQRIDWKGSQDATFNALLHYGTYGKHNDWLNTLSNEELKAADPQMLPNMIKDLNKYEHRVVYFGPSSEKDIIALLAKEHKTPNKLLPVPEGQPYKEQIIDKDETWIAPYDAKNIQMTEIMNTGKKWDVNKDAVRRMFNEYYSGGMGAIVLQELREARGLAYTANANYDRPEKANGNESFYIGIITQNDKMMDCINTFRDIIDNMPQSQNGFDIAKKNLTKYLQCYRSTRHSVLYGYITTERMGLKEDLYKLAYDKLPSIKLQDIVDFEKKNVVGNPRRRIILGNKDELDIKALEKLGPVRYLTTEEIFGF